LSTEKAKLLKTVPPHQRKNRPNHSKRKLKNLLLRLKKQKPSFPYQYMTSPVHSRAMGVLVMFRFE
jgi:hypothetical protein